MRKPFFTILIATGIALAVCTCLLFIVISVPIITGSFPSEEKTSIILPSITTSTPILQNVPTQTPFEITSPPIEGETSSTLHMLQQALVPEKDLAVLACRFRDICDVPATKTPPSISFEIGAPSKFWLLNTKSNQYSMIDVTLVYVTPHAYFWVENGIEINQDDVRILMNTFENRIFPTDREFFGSEWTPGVDGDDHLYIVYARTLGGVVSGFFNSGDEYLPQINHFSNAHETFYIDSSQDPAYDYTYGTLAHEFQHMIHWYQDRNESSFLNEGFSKLAEYLNGYDIGGFDWFYTTNPDINLTDWHGDASANSDHYGANFLFVTYFLDRFGKEATQALIHDQQNSFSSVDNILQSLNITDPFTNQQITSDDFFLDWTLANYIHDPKVADGRYYYENYPNSPTIFDTEGVYDCPMNLTERTINQYGVDYIRFTCSGKYMIVFTGSTQTRLLPVDPHSGTFGFWSNKGDESNMTLTRQFDLRGISSPITFSFWTWYDLETDYDYVFLDASTDGISWKILTTSSGSADNPSGNSYGWGYNGQSNGWRLETVDLSQYAGQLFWLRFDYITDGSANGEGFLVDDMTIPSIEYSEDFETGDGGWVGAGFVRIQKSLPQGFRLALITHASNGTFVEPIKVNSDLSVQIPVEIGSNGVKDVVLVVTATSRFSLEQAMYQVSVR